MSRIGLRCFLLTGTAIAAGCFPLTAQAATVTAVADGTWASAGGANSTNVANATTGDNLTINGSYNITVQNTGSANDGGGTSVFTLGSVADTGVLVSQLSIKGNTTANIGSINNIKYMTNETTAAGNIAVSVSGDLILDGDGSITNSSTNSGTLTVNGNLSTAGNFFVERSGTGTTTMNVSGNVAGIFQFGGNTGANSSIANFNGAATQTVSGRVRAHSVAGQGILNIKNTSAGGVVFNETIGDTGGIYRINVGSGTTDTTVKFSKNVTTTGGIILGDGGGSVQISKAVFDMAGGGITIASAINSDGTDTGNVVIQGNNWATITSSWGQTGKLNNIALSDAAGVNVNLQASLRANTITGTGGGTHMIQLIGIDGEVDANVTGIDFQIASVNTLTFKGSISSGEARLQNTGSKIIIDNGVASGNFSSSIKSTTGGGQTSFLELKSGLMSGNYIGAASDDTLTFAGGAFTGTANFGAGNDTLTFAGADGAISNSVTNLETLNLNSRKLTLSSSISGMTTDVNIGAGGELAFNTGGIVDRAINGNDGTVSFGSNNAGGTFNLSVGIRDAILNVASGTVKTNGIVMGSGGGANAMHNLTIGSNGILAAQDNIISAGTLRVDGELQITNGKTVSVAGYNSASAGTITFDVADNGTLTGGLLDLGSAALDLTSSKVKVNVTTNPETMTKGQTLKIAQNAGTITLPTAAVIDNSNKYALKLSAQGGNLVLTVDEAIVFTGLTPGTLAVTPVFTGLTGGDSFISRAQNNLSNAASLQEKERIAESVNPTLDTGHVQAALNVMNASFDMIDQRIAALGSMTGLSAGDNMTGERRIWGQAFGEIGKQGERSGVAGYDSTTAGAAIGIDRDLWNGRGLLGIALSYADTSVNSANANSTDTDISSYQLTVYGDYDLNDLYYIRGMGALSRHYVSQVRHDVGGVGGLSAKSDFDAMQTTIRAQLGQNLNGWRGMTLSPHALSNYSRYQADGYSESGAGGLNQNVRQDSLSLFEVGAGLEVRKTLEAVNGDRVEPSVRTSYRYDLSDDNLRMSSQFSGGGNPYIINAPSPARGTFTTGVGLKFEGHAGLSLSADYEFETRRDYLSHAATFRVGKRF